MGIIGLGRVSEGRLQGGIAGSLTPVRAGVVEMLDDQHRAMLVESSDSVSGWCLAIWWYTCKRKRPK